MGKKQKPFLVELFGNIFNYGLGGVIPQVVGFFLIPLYARHLSPADYGIVDLAGSLGLFLVPLMRLGVPGAITRFYFDMESLAQLNNLIFSNYRFLIKSAAIIAASTLVLFFFIGDYILPGLGFYPFVILVVVEAFFNSSIHIQRKLIIAKKESALSAKLNIAKAVLGILITLLVVVVFHMGALGMILAKLIVTIVFAIQARYYLRNYIANGQQNNDYVRKSLNYGLGVLPHHLFISAAPLISKSLLNGFGGLAALGVYGIATRFNQPLSLLIQAISPTIQPMYFEFTKKADEESIRLRNIMIDVIVFSGIILFALTINILTDIIPLILPVKYHEAAPLIPLIGIGFVGQLMYLVFVNELFYLKKTKVVSIITLTGLSVSIVLSLLLVRHYEATGIALAGSASFVVWAIMAYIITRRLSDVTFNWRLISISLVVASCSVVLAISDYSEKINYSLLLVVLVLFPFAAGIKMHSFRRIIDRFKKR